MPTIPTGWSYACSSPSNYKKSDGTGWIPVDLTGKISELPIDNVNQSPYYWTYVTNGTQYHLASLLATSNNQLGGSSDKTSNDGGSNTALYESGTNTNLYPINGLVINGGFELAPNFIAAQTSGAGRWIDGSATGTTTIQEYSIHAGFGGAGGDRYVQFDNSTSHTGDYSLKLHMSAGSYSEPRVNSTCYYCAAGIKILPNTTYRWSVWMKSENITGSSSSGQKIQFLFSNSSGGSATVSFSGSGGSGSSSEFGATPYILTNNPWTNYTGTFTTGATVAWFHPEYRVYGHTGAATLAGDFWFDDIAVWQQ